MDTVLEHLIYGQPIVSNATTTSPDVLALSAGLEASASTRLRNATPLYPLPNADTRASQSIALTKLDIDDTVGDDEMRFILARSHFQGDDQTLPVYQYIFLTGATLQQLGGDLQPLLSFFEQPITPYKATHLLLDPLELPAPATWTLDKQVAVLKTLLDDIMKGDMSLLLSILGAVLDDRGLVIRHFPADAAMRTSLVRGLRMLLPAIARPQLTFTLHTNHHTSLPRLTFTSNNDDIQGIRCFDWQQPTNNEKLLQASYPAHLLALWEDDMIKLVRHLHDLDLLAGPLMTGKTLSNGLQALVERHQHDLAVVRQDNKVSTNEMLGVLDSKTPPDGQLRIQYMEQLLRRALDERDEEAVSRITQEMDADDAVAEKLDAVLQAALETQPDAVYVLARTRLSDGLDDVWLDRLHAAGRHSLEVAIDQGDPEILGRWLTLVAREPKRYDMGKIVSEGIIAARSRAYDSAELAQQMLTIAVKRQPDLLPSLLSDPHILATLPEQQVASLRDYDPQAIETLADDSREIFLLALHQALTEQQPCISPTAIRQLWALHIGQQTKIVAPQYRPIAIIEQIAQDDNAALLDGVLETLLSLMLADEAYDLFYEVATLLKARAALEDVLVAALEESGREIDDILLILTHLLTNKNITPQTAVDSYTTLLTNRNWNDNSQPLIEQLARVMSQYPDTQATSIALWNIVEMSEDLKNEQMLRVGVRRLLADLGDSVSEEQLIEKFLRLRAATHWNGQARTRVMLWWREYARTCTLAQLQKLDRGLAHQRGIEEMRSVIQTTIALRRVVGQRSLIEFAAALNTTYSTLQALADGFDPQGKQTITVDSLTIRGEIDAHSDELSSDERHVLAANLKELAQLITTMADNRSRPILRSDDTIERHLVTGIQHPQSAIDVMRWLSGYLDGAQDDNKES